MMAAEGFLKSVTKDEFDAWLKTYPRPLAKSLMTIVYPERVQYNDFSLGDWPKSVVAQYSAAGGDPANIWADVPGNWMVASSIPMPPQQGKGDDDGA